MKMQMDSPVVPATEVAFDIWALWFRFLRRLPVFIGVAMVIMVAVVAYTLTRTPHYHASSSVLIEPHSNNALQNLGSTGDQPTDSAVVDTETQLLASHAIARRVAQKLNLQTDPEFNAAAATTKPDPNAPVPEYVVGGVMGRTSVKRSGTTYLIDVGFTSLYPEKAAQIANAIAEEYIAAQTEAKQDASTGALDNLSGRLVTLRQELEAEDAAVQNYKISHGLMSANGATNAEQEVSALNQQIATARADQAEKEARLAAARDQMSRGGNGGDVSAVLASDVIKTLRSQRSEVSRRQAELETRYGPLHPDVKKVDRELDDIDAQINAETTRLISNLQADVQVARQRTASLERSKGSANGSLSSNAAAAVTLNELQRKADATRAIYEAFLNKQKETESAQGIQRADARIASPAQVPGSPSSPNVPLNIALGLVVSVLAGFAAVLALETLDSSMRTSKEVESKLQMPCVGAVPKLPRKEVKRVAQFIIEKPFSSFAESFRDLRTSLLFSRNDRPVKVIAITSSLPGEGKTLTSATFGRSVAQSGGKTLIIDADFRRRTLTASFEREVSAGFLEVMEGSATLAEAVMTDEMSGAYLLLLTDRRPPSSDLITGATLDPLFEQLRAEYDTIIVDTAPVLAVAESRVLCAHADATVFLLRWGKTAKQAANASLDLLLNAGAFVAGVCMTQVDLAKQSRLGYGDKLYYYRAYRSYYAD